MTHFEPLAMPIADAAKAIGCGKSKFYEMVKAGDLPVIKLGRKTVVAVAALRAFIDAKAKEAA